ncbi:zinc ribbon domain-containing protein [Jiangella gansuensis]|uniref:zinc ribbon domain-containing protein n=1 Tax=Jiangella gansuensis TaxID=281473 RepID=UPI00047E4516|nr:zinc ribbon domain-containing protein [Jiangella gansuensis]
MNFCSNCGAPATGTAYCGNCGTPMTADTSAPAGAGASGAGTTGAAGAGASATVGQPGQPQAGARPGAVGAQAVRPNPFADIPVLDYVRDVVALVLLLVSFGMPWDLADTATGKVYVILVTLLSIVSLSLPYLKRGGVLPVAWGSAELRLARLAANAPYVVVVLITLVLGYVGENNGDGIGVGIAFGLAGALLAAQGRQAEQTPADGGDGALWRWISLGIGGLFALLTLISLIVFLTDGAENLDWEQITYAVVAMLAMFALAALPLWGVLRGDAAWRDVLITLGAVALFVNVWQLNADETMPDAWSLSHAGPWLVLVPALAVAVSAPALNARFQARAGAAHWVAVAARMFLLTMLAAAVGVVLYVLSLIAVETGRGVGIVVLVLLLISALAALVGRNALVRSPNQGRAVAVVAAGVLILLGVVVAAVLGGSDDQIVAVPDAVILSLLWWFGVAVIVVLTAPGSVRGEFGPVGASQLNLSSVLPGNGNGTATSTADASTTTAAGATAGGAAGTAAAGAAAAGREKQRDDVPASPAVPSESETDKPAGTDSREPEVRAADVPVTEEPVVEEPSEERLRDGLAGAPEQSSAESAGSRAGAAEADASGERAADAGTAEEEAAAEPDAAEPGGPREASGLNVRETAGPISGLAVSEPAAADSAETRADRPAVDDVATRVQPSVDATRVDQPAVSESGFDARTALDPNTPLQTLADIAAQEPGLRKYIAANPSTYPELLDWLGQLGDPEVDEALRRRGR